MANMTVGDLMDMIKNLDRNTPVCLMCTAGEESLAKPVSMTGGYYGGPGVCTGYMTSEPNQTGLYQTSHWSDPPVRTDGWDYAYTLDPTDEPRGTFHYVCRENDPQVLLIQIQTPDDYCVD
jgi:hypothetical protein